MFPEMYGVTVDECWATLIAMQIPGLEESFMYAGLALGIDERGDQIHLDTPGGLNEEDE